MIVVAIVLGLIAICTMFAYVPIFLIIGYNLREKPVDDRLLQRYMAEEISTDEYLRLVEKQWESVQHAPLR